MNNEIKVTVLCLVYNHEKYLRSALDGFINQKTDFRYEVLIHDDASTDNSAEIIKEYEQRYPDIIKPIYQTENQFSKGIKITRDILLPHAMGEYLAWCEGDDYWIDEKKLQIEYDALSKHPEINICAHAARVINAVTGEFIENNTFSKETTVIPVERVIIGEGGIVPTASIMMKKDTFAYSGYTFDKDISHDYVIQIKGSIPNGMLFLNNVMSVYRKGVPNSFCSRLNNNLISQTKYEQRKIAMLDKLDKDTSGKYHDAIQARMMLYKIIHINSAKENQKYMNMYKNGLRALNLKERFKIYVKCICPWLLRCIHKVW